MHKIYLALIATVTITANNMNHVRSSHFATTEPGIQREYLLSEFRICSTEMPEQILKNYLQQLANSIGLAAKTDVLIFKNKQPAEQEADLEGIFVGKEGGMRAYYWRKPRLLTVDIQTHGKQPNADAVTQLTKQMFGLIESSEFVLTPESVKAENRKVEVRGHAYGQGVYAKEDIKAGEFIGGLYGKFHEAEDCMSIDEQYRDHVMQCADHIWRANEFSHEAVQYLNHSCQPNCGVQGLFDFVAMRNIKAGEEITTDYAMQDDSNWEVPGGKCLCGAPICRGKILPYRDLTKEDKDMYKNYVSHWILHKYKICSCPS